MRKVRYVQEFVPGSFVSDSSVRRFDEDEETFRPTHAYMWRFLSKWETIAPDGMILASLPFEESPLRVYGIEHTLEAVEKGGPEYGGALLANMRCNDWRRVVQCAQGMLPADDKIIIDPSERPTGRTFKIGDFDE